MSNQDIPGTISAISENTEEEIKKEEKIIKEDEPSEIKETAVLPQTEDPLENQKSPPESPSKSQRKEGGAISKIRPQTECSLRKQQQIQASSSSRNLSVPSRESPSGDLEVLENGLPNPNARTRATFSS
ncbi:hypothetical protein X975_14246, partial [Stegodyphus mimosarum]